MADTIGILDGSTTETTRSINASPGVQTFSYTSDPSYSLGPNDPEDFIRLTVSRRSSLVLTLKSQSGNANLELLDYTGTLSEGKSENSGTLTDALLFKGADALDPGTYYIRVFAPDSSITSNYTLSVNTTDAIRSDLLWRNYASGDNGYWVMNGTQLVSGRSFLKLADLNWQLKGSADFDGDGIGDYLWRNVATGYNGIWLMDANNNLRAGVSIPSVNDPAWKMGPIGDFNKDGYHDIIWRNTTTGQNVAWLMNGTRYVSNSFLASEPDANWQAVAAADFDQDGYTDLVWRNAGNGQNRIWLMNRTSYVGTSFFVNQADTRWDIVGTADFNGDNHMDIVLRNKTTGENGVWYMNKTQFQGGAYLPAVSGANWQIGGTVTTPSLMDLAGNTLNTAFDVGSVGAGGNATYKDGIGSTADTWDYYKFTLTANSTLKISVTGLVEAAEVRLIRDTNKNGSIDQGEILTSATRVTDANGTIQDLIPETQLAPETYFVMVEDTSRSISNYTLTLNAKTFKELDLQPISFLLSQTSANISTPQTITATYGVQNTGSETGANFRVGFYLSRDNIITTSDRQIALSDVISLTANQSKTNLTQSLVLPAAIDRWWGSDQTYYLGMIVDPGNSTSPTGEVLEVNENNNAFNAGINITGTIRPDLEGGGLQAQVVGGGSATAGSSIQLTGSVKNKGNRATGAQSTDTFEVTFVISTDDKYDLTGDRLLGTATFKSINAKSFTSFDSNVVDRTQAAYFTRLTTPPTPYIQLPDASWEGWKKGNGTYYIAMWIDDLGVVDEGSAAAVENNANYGRVIGQYIDYNVINITGLPSQA